MKKILFITLGKGVSDRTLWSGIPYSFYNELCQYYDVENFVVPETHPFATNVKYVINKVCGKNYHRGFDLAFAYSVTKKVQKHIDENEYDFIIAIGSQTIFNIKTSIPILYFADAVFCGMVDYYWKNLSKNNIDSGNLIQKNALDNAKYVVLTSNWARNNAITNYGIQPNKVQVIHFGSNIEVNDFSSIAHDDINLLFVGVDWERKGADIAVECTKILNEYSEGKHYVLHLVGCNPPNEINDRNVILYGFLNRNIDEQRDKLDYLRAISDFFILPTQAECAGIVFCEACAYSLPSITFDTGGIPDYVINGKNGVRLPLGSSAKDFADAIMDITKDEEGMIKMKENARVMYEQDLNWQYFGKKIREIIDSDGL